MLDISEGNLLLIFFKSTRSKDTPSRQFGRLGISYRLDMHANDQYIEEKGRAGRTKKRKEKNKTKKKKNKRIDGVNLESNNGVNL